MSDEVVREKYSLSEGATFDGSFSKVSIENILFSVIATAIFALEYIFDAFSADIDRKISSATVASIPWYHKICLEYQHGDSLQYDESTGEFRYPAEDATKRVVKYAAVRESQGGVVSVIVSGDTAGEPSALPADVLTAFRSYLNARKPAGIIVSASSYHPDDIKFSIVIQYDEMTLDAQGQLIGTQVKPAEDAIKAYLKGITYGGVFNKTKLVDALQGVSGVKDVLLTSVLAKPNSKSAWDTVSGNNYSSTGGSFLMSDQTQITYQTTTL